MEGVPKNEKPKLLFIWKSHHSFCDGISAQSLLLSLSKDYDRSFFLGGKDASMMMKILARLMIPLQIPKLIMNLFISTKDKNLFSKKRNQISKLSGNINCSTSKKVIEVDKIK